VRVSWHGIYTNPDRAGYVMLKLAGWLARKIPRSCGVASIYGRVSALELVGLFQPSGTSAAGGVHGWKAYSSWDLALALVPYFWTRRAQS